MPLKTLEIPFSVPPVPFEVASLLLSFVAYPDDVPSRKSFFRELCRREHISQERKHHRAESIQKLIRPILFSSQRDGDWIKGLEALRLHLLIASEILAPFVSLHETGKKLATRKGCSATVKEIGTSLMIREGWETSISTFQTRYWVPIRPIAHLAFSLAELVYADRWKASKGGWKHIQRWISPYPDDGLALRVLERAEVVRLFLPELKRVRFSEERTIRFIARKVLCNELSSEAGTKAEE
jgi:hypothetical protein